jgi:hypothetical protein
MAPVMKVAASFEATPNTIENALCPYQTVENKRAVWNDTVQSFIPIRLTARRVN